MLGNLMLDWNKGKIKPCKFANLTTPEAACVDHPDIVVLFIWRYVFYPPLPISLKGFWGDRYTMELSPTGGFIVEEALF